MNCFDTPKQWIWQGYPICYQTMGTEGPAVLLIHGFGASWGHWRHTIPDLAQYHRVYALDLIGFGASAKPYPDKALTYTFETWSMQIRDFCREVIGESTFFVGNSIGCIAAMQAAVDETQCCSGIALLNCSIRMLHERRLSQLPWYRQIGAPLLQQILGIRWIGHQFFNIVARPNVIKNILLQAYARPEAVTEDLIDLLLKPAFDEGAADVFLAFTRYSQGPLPEELLAQLNCPVIILWGEDDPWEPISEGQELLAHYPCVEDFFVLKNAGHCPQDEAPEQVNPILVNWFKHHSVAIVT